MSPRRVPRAALTLLVALAGVSACTSDPPSSEGTSSQEPTAAPSDSAPTSPGPPAATAAPDSPLRFAWVQRDGAVVRIDVRTGAATTLYEESSPAYRQGDAVIAAADEGLEARDPQTGRVLGSAVGATSGVREGSVLAWAVPDRAEAVEGCSGTTELTRAEVGSAARPRVLARLDTPARVVALLADRLIVQTLSESDACDERDVVSVRLDGSGAPVTMARGVVLVTVARGTGAGPALWVREAEGLDEAEGAEARELPLRVLDERGRTLASLPRTGNAAAGRGPNAGRTAYTQVTIREPGSVAPSARTDELRIASGLPVLRSDPVESRFTVVANLQWSLDGRHVVFTATDPRDLSQRRLGVCTVAPMSCSLTAVAVPTEDPTFALLAAL